MLRFIRYLTVSLVVGCVGFGGAGLQFSLTIYDEFSNYPSEAGIALGTEA